MGCFGTHRLIYVQIEHMVVLKGLRSPPDDLGRRQVRRVGVELAEPCSRTCSTFRK